MRKVLLFGCSWLAAGLLAPSAAQAYLIDPDTCNPKNLTITRVESAPIDGNGVIYDGTINSTKCFGVNTAGAPANNDDAGGRSSPSPNIGHLYDGFLNGEPLPNPPPKVAPGDIAMDPYYFIDSPGVDDSPSLSTPHDIPGNASTEDPGWIHLANINFDGTTTYSNLGTGDGALNIGDLIDINWSCLISGCSSGTWSLETESDIVDQVQSILGPNAFDHLAISIFQANRLAVYDFDFTILNQPGKELAGLLDFVTPYSFTGTWDMSDFTGNSDSFSHVNFWARDPLILQTVPAPMSWALVLIGLLGLMFTSRRHQVRMNRHTV